MVGKKNEMKFTILFSPSNPDHVFAANKLNQQSRNNKANYIAQAIKVFEDSGNPGSNTIVKTLLDVLTKQNAPLALERNNAECLDDLAKENINSALQIFKRS